MIRMAKNTKLSSEQVIAKAVEVFGPGGWGLEVEESDACCARFVGTGGYVFFQATENEIDGNREVVVEGREWDYQIRDFVGDI